MADAAKLPLTYPANGMQAAKMGEEERAKWRKAWVSFGFAVLEMSLCQIQREMGL